MTGPFLTLPMGNLCSNTPRWTSQHSPATHVRLRLFPLNPSSFLLSFRGIRSSLWSDSSPSLLWPPPHFPNKPLVYLVSSRHLWMEDLNWRSSKLPYQLFSASPAASLGTRGSLTTGVAAPGLGISHQCACLPYPYLKYVLELPTGLGSANWIQNVPSFTEWLVK